MEILTHGLVDSEAAEGYREQMTSNQALMLKVAARALLFLESKLWTDCRGWLKVLEFRGSRASARRAVVLSEPVSGKKEPLWEGNGIRDVFKKSMGSWEHGVVLQGASIALSRCIACRASPGSLPWLPLFGLLETLTWTYCCTLARGDLKIEWFL